MSPSGGIIFERRLVGRCLTALSAQTGYIERMKCILFGGIWKVWQHKKLALKKKKVEEGCVDLDPLTWPQAAESDGTGKPETTGTTCSCSVDSYVTRLRETEGNT